MRYSRTLGLFPAGFIWAVALISLMAWPAQSISQGFQYRLGAGDQLRVTVFGHEDLSGVFLVGGDGIVSLPLIGEIKSENLTLQEFETAVTDKLKPDYLKNPQVSVEVANYRPFYIMGEVVRPGSYPYVNGMQVVNAIAIAGGFTYRAKESEVYITRAEGSGNIEVVDTSTPVLPGDVIQVPERFF